MDGTLVLFTPSGPAVVTDWAVTSGLGVGRDEFVAGFRAAERDGRTGRSVEGFDPKAALGRKGTRTLDRMTALVIATAGSLLADRPEGSDARASVGLVLGSSTGSIASITEFTRDTFVRDRPYLVDPSQFPNTVMNSAAGRTAIWYGLRGLNSTIAAGHLTGLVALRYASRMIRLGYADTLLVGAVEEVSAPIAVAAAAIRGAGMAGPGGGDTPLGEGCVLFTVRSGSATDRADGSAPAAEVVDFELGNADADADAGARSDRLARAIRALLARTGIGPDEIELVSLAQSGDGELDKAERAAVDAVLGGSARRLAASERLGNTFSALGAFQLAAVLAVLGPAPTRPGRPCLLTGLGTDGAVGCALIRV